MQSRFFAAAALALAFAAQPLFSQDAAPASPPAQTTPGAPPHRPLPRPVNLQVLPKDTTPENLIKIMRGFTGSLGVECNFCHTRNQQTKKLDFASDAKPEKATARIMIAMTRDANQQYMSKINDPDAGPEDKHVTCGTCHRGHHMPEHFVPPPEEHHGPPAGAMPSPDAPSGQKPQ